MTRLLVLPSLAPALLLAACGSDKAPATDAAGEDPALTGALGDQIMVDPDLAGQNRAGQALGANGPVSVELPPAQRSAEAINAAKAEAAKLAGGSITEAPAPLSGPEATAAVTPAQLAEAAKGMGSGCADKVEYSAGWAARLPAALTVYPRGHVVEAAGTDRDGCRLRVINYVTPVSGKDVIDFYYTRSRAAGYDAEHRLEGKDSVLGGSKDTAAFVIYARKLSNGLTEVDIVANGG